MNRRDMLIQALAAVGGLGAATIENALLIEQWQEESPLPPVDLMPGDLLVIHVGLTLTKERAAAIKSAFGSKLPGVKLIVVQDQVCLDFPIRYGVEGSPGVPLDPSASPVEMNLRIPDGSEMEYQAARRPLFQFQRIRLGVFGE